MLLHHRAVEPRRVEGTAVIGAPQGLAVILGLLRPGLPLRRAAAFVLQVLAIPVHTVTRRGDQPAVFAQAFGEVPAGRGENVMRGFEPGDEVRRVRDFAWLETHEGMQVMRLAAHRLEPAMQLAAVGIAGQYGAALALHETPEHAVEQAPALLTTVLCGALQQIQQFGRYAQATAGLRRTLGGLVEQAGVFLFVQPLQLMGSQALQ